MNQSPVLAESSSALAMLGAVDYHTAWRVVIFCDPKFIVAETLYSPPRTHLSLTSDNSVAPSS